MPTQTLVATPDPEPAHRYDPQERQRFYREAYAELAQILADVEAGRTELVWR